VSRISIIATLVVVGLSAERIGPIFAQSPTSDSTPSKTTSCVFDFQRGEIHDCIHENATGELFVAPRVTKELHFDSYGLAPVLSLKTGWMYVNRKGKVVVNGVPQMDNGPDSFHDGLVRIVKNEKYGFANRQGDIVVPAIYDGALNFENGTAKVCKGCRNKCADADCEHRFFSGGDWLVIDTKGLVVSRPRPE